MRDHPVLVLLFLTKMLISI